MQSGFGWILVNGASRIQFFGYSIEQVWHEREPLRPILRCGCHPLVWLSECCECANYVINFISQDIRLFSLAKSAYSLQRFLDRDLTSGVNVINKVRIPFPSRDNLTWDRKLEEDRRCTTKRLVLLAATREGDRDHRIHRSVSVLSFSLLRYSDNRALPQPITINRSSQLFIRLRRWL